MRAGFNKNIVQDMHIFQLHQVFKNKHSKKGSEAE